MTSRKSKSAAYEVGYGKPPRHTRFRKGQSGNPSGRPRRTATQQAKALALREAYRRITVKDGGRAQALPAIQAILRSQVGLAAKGNVQAQRAVLAAIQAIEWENVVEERAAEHSIDPRQAARVAVHLMRQENVEAAAPAAPNAYATVSYTEAARRVMSLLRLGEAELEPNNEQEKKAESAAPAENDKAPTAAPRATYADRVAMMEASRFFAPSRGGEGS